MKKLLTIVLVVASIATSCKEPKSKTIVNHVIQSIDTMSRWNATIQQAEPVYIYHFIDGDSMKTAKEQFRIGDTVQYIYYKY
jgi:hypothetical protein